MTLYEIDQSILECIDLETGEVVDAERLDALHIEREEKIENVALWYKNLMADAEAYKAEKNAFYEREKAARNKAESLKEWLKNALEGQNFKTTKAAVSFRNSEVVVVKDIYAIPDDFLRYEEPSVDKMAVKKALKDGMNIAGVVLETNSSITVK